MAPAAVAITPRTTENHGALGRRDRECGVVHGLGGIDPVTDEAVSDGCTHACEEDITCRAELTAVVIRCEGDSNDGASRSHLSTQQVALDDVEDAGDGVMR